LYPCKVASDEDVKSRYAMLRLVPSGDAADKVIVREAEE
jgi:hypothetical protein